MYCSLQTVRNYKDNCLLCQNTVSGKQYGPFAEHLVRQSFKGYASCIQLFDPKPPARGADLSKRRECLHSQPANRMKMEKKKVNPGRRARAALGYGPCGGGR